MKLSLRIAVALAASAVALPLAAADTAPAAKAKNVILFIGDGMGISTITAIRIYDGQSKGGTGEENVLPFETFPNVALVKTYNTNAMVPDSAGTATAINTGVKTREGAIDVGPAAHIGDCAEGLANRLPNAAERLSAAGKQIGIVTTTRITHATPAAVYAHVPDRDWESDAAIPEAERSKGCTDIAAQLVDFPFTVALGGGAGQFAGKAKGGIRIDPAADLAGTWAKSTGGNFVTTAEQMRAAAGSAKPLLGLFTPSHMSYMLDRKPETTEPTLTEMTLTAIDKLSKAPEGYFLMVEGGKIDHGHHEGRPAYALSEGQEFANAIGAALQKIDLSETLVLVTADHSHVFTIAGYPTRGSPILGYALANDKRGDPTGKPILALDGKPYAILGYANGPGAVKELPRPDPATEPKVPQQALVPTGDVFNGTPSPQETHGGEDVALFATGPGSEAAHGVIEQNRIYDIMMQALGMEPE